MNFDTSYILKNEISSSMYFQFWADIAWINEGMSTPLDSGNYEHYFTCFILYFNEAFSLKKFLENLLTALILLL
jgi:hypothetical protein